jgi:putative aminopeptidase FrvX
MPILGASQLKLLERLCNAVAVSGDEGEVRAIVLEEIKGYADEVKVDALGNVLAIKHGTERRTEQSEARRQGADSARLKVMLSAHMDEVGFMLVGEDGEGIYRFEPVGGMDVRQLAGKAVLVGRDHTPGVIGARPIHLTTVEERQHAIPLDALRIDLGPAGKAALGDRATFATRFQRSGPAVIAKALDNRLGVATLIELIKTAPLKLDLLAAFTVQEEIGLRGARVAAYALNPDLAIAVDATPANDLPSWDGEENVSYNTRLGLGPAIYIADGATFSDPRLVRLLTEAGEAAKIPFQFRQPGGGGTDAGAIHRERAGIPSVSVSVPSRYAHTAALVARLDDWKNTLALLQAALGRITPELLTGERT